MDIHVAYLLHRFPSLTETFIAREIDGVRRKGARVSIYALRPGPGGHEEYRQLLALARYERILGLSAVAALVSFLLRRPCRLAAALLRTLRLTWREPGVLARALVLFPAAVSFAQRAENEGVHHVHAHFAWLGSIAADAVKTLTGIPYTVHPHAFDIFQRNQADVRRQLESADGVVTIADYHRRYIAALCRGIREEDVDVVHCGIETDRFVPREGARRPGPFRILTVGRLIPKKGIGHLVDACAVLAGQGKDVECRIVGDGPLRPALETQASELGLGGRVAFLGALQQADVLALYRDSDCFVLPCVIAKSGDRDGIPVVLMEAMACGLPVVTTPVAGIPDLVRHGRTGLLVPEAKAELLAAAVTRFLDSPERARDLGRGGRALVQESFDIERSAEAMLAVFRKVSGRKAEPCDSRVRPPSLRARSGSLA